MPYIVTTIAYPTHKISEVVKIYAEHQKKYPHDRSLSKELVPAAVTTNGKGVLSFSIELVKEGKLEEALKYVGKVLTLYQPVEDLEYKVRVWQTVVEAFDMLGMKTPGQ